VYPLRVPIPRRILLIRPSAMGDVARTAPLLASLRATFPDTRIDWLVQDTFIDLIRAHPALTNTVPFRRHLHAGESSISHLLALRRSLAGSKYDLVIDAQGLARSALLALATGAPRRIGLASAREFATLAYTQTVSTHAVHTVDRMLALASTAGAVPRTDPLALRLYTPPDARSFVATSPRLAGRRYVVIAPTSRWIAKQWPDERFAAVAQELAAEGLTIALVGATGERHQVPRCLDLALANPNVIDILGRTSVGQLMNLIEHAALVLANDSAALHIAVAFNRPLVALFGPTHVDLVGPYRRPGDVIRHVSARDRMDHKDARCRVLMERIGVAEVLEACRARLSG
jgi:heptosyltransferase-1